MDTLGKYQLISELGRGGFATVYRAEDTTLGREVALKVLDPLLMRDTAWVQHFRREARTVAALDHPRIVTIYEIAEAEGRLFLAMKLIEGPSLDKALEARGALPWEEALRTAREIAESLDYAHSKGILHRDLKPGNVLLDPRNGAVLTDFGFARLVGESSLSLSMSGGLVGTPYYLAPELWHNKPASAASDLYALGCILYELVLGRKAFPGETPPAVMTAHLLQPLDLPERWPANAPPKMADVLRAALAREPEARIGSAADFLKALESLEADPLAEAYAALEAAVAGERWDEALRLAEDILAQQPAYRETAALAQRAQAGLERMQRVELARQWQQQAETALRDGHPEVARAAVEQWQRLLPEDARAQAAAAEAARQQRLQAEAQEQHAAQARAERERQRYPVQQVAPAQSVVTAPVQQPALQSAPKRKAFPIWAWVLLGIVILVGGFWGMSSLGIWAISNLKRAIPPTTATLEHATPPKTAALGDTWTRPADGMVMVYVPAGEFQMGSEDGDDDEKPVHTVALDGFWIDRTEVSNAQYQRCVAAGKCEASRCASDSKYNGATQPVVCVSWHDAAAYCAWAGGRLPTEAEWEYAARGPEGLKYPWGNTWQERVANCAESVCKDGYERTAPVGSFPQGASWVGAMDLAGNVWEWVADWYGPYPTGRQVNPTGPSHGEFRVLRGGSWLYSGRSLRGANRNRNTPSNTNDHIGFRCVASWSPGE